MWKKILKDLSLPESYISITLGFLVVIVAGLLIYNYFNKSSGQNLGQNPTPSPVDQLEEIAVLPTMHTINANENLWTIAEKYYNSGYNWVTLAKENNIVNPDHILVGQKISIPKADPILLTKDKISSSATGSITSYTVVKNDSLWKIAVREYGDGYAWVKIAQTNNLKDPDIIHPGDVLRLVR